MSDQHDSAPSVADQIKEAVDAAEAAKDIVIAELREELARIESLANSLADDVASLTEKGAVAVKDIEAVLERYSHDIIGQAHAIFHGIKELVEKSKVDA